MRFGSAPTFKVTAIRPSEDTEEQIAALYVRLRPKLDTPENAGKMLILDVASGDYELGGAHGDGASPARHLQARHPGAPLYGIRIGYRAAESFGGVNLREDEEEMDRYAIANRTSVPL